MNKLLLKLDDLEDRDGCVLVTLTGPNAAGFARFHQTFGGSSWECDGDEFAYAMPMADNSLVSEARDLCGDQNYWDWKDSDEHDRQAHVALDLSEYCGEG